MAGLRAVPHAPFDGARLASVLDSEEDLHRAASDAAWPVDAAQWQGWLSRKECHPYFLMSDGRDIGHFALFTSVPGKCHLSFLVLSRGAQGGQGRAVMGLIEGLMRSDHGARAATLNVYKDNLRALALYRGGGYQETEDNEHILSLEKPL